MSFAIRFWFIILPLIFILYYYISKRKKSIKFRKTTGLDPEKEVKLKHNNREVLYVIGQAVIEASCCGGGSCGYAIVPGYILNWQNKTNEAGLPVSEVEPISDKATQENIFPGWEAT